jgi:predicted O-methyltransferase YrrM
MLKSIFRRGVKSVTGLAHKSLSRDLKQRMDLETTLNWILRDLKAGDRNNPMRFVSLLRDCIDQMKCSCRRVKGSGGNLSEPEKKFDAFTSLLNADVPPIRTQAAIRIAEIADDYRGSRNMAGRSREPIGHHFGVASSAGKKIRMLSIAIKYFQPEQIVELGTAYGISSLAMGYALQEIATDERKAIIHTLEAFEPQATLSRELLGRELGSVVHCVKGLADQSLAPMAKETGGIDFVFHDAGHTYEDYQHDFGVLEPFMKSGSILLLDDIRWNDLRDPTKATRTYEGWQAIVAHPRVKRAAEIDDEIGLVLIA